MYKYVYNTLSVLFCKNKEKPTTFQRGIRRRKKKSHSSSLRVPLSPPTPAKSSTKKPPMSSLTRTVCLRTKSRTRLSFRLCRIFGFLASFLLFSPNSRTLVPIVRSAHCTHHNGGHGARTPVIGLWRTPSTLQMTSRALSGAPVWRRNKKNTPIEGWSIWEGLRR